jgi:hypothetical protein
MEGVRILESGPLTTKDVQRMTGWSERTVRLHARELGGKRPLNARAWQFTLEGVRAGAVQLGLVLAEPEPNEEDT